MDLKYYLRFFSALMVQHERVEKYLALVYFNLYLMYREQPKLFPIIFYIRSGQFDKTLLKLDM